MTQTELAAKTGRSTAYVNQLITGHNDHDTRVAAIEGAYVKKDGSVDMTGPLKWTESGDEYVRVPRLTTRDGNSGLPVASRSGCSRWGIRSENSPAEYG